MVDFWTRSRSAALMDMVKFVGLFCCANQAMACFIHNRNVFENFWTKSLGLGSIDPLSSALLLPPGFRIWCTSPSLHIYSDVVKEYGMGQVGIDVTISNGDWKMYLLRLNWHQWKEFFSCFCDEEVKDKCLAYSVWGVPFSRLTPYNGPPNIETMDCNWLPK